MKKSCEGAAIHLSAKKADTEEIGKILDLDLAISGITKGVAFLLWKLKRDPKLLYPSHPLFSRWGLLTLLLFISCNSEKQMK